MIEIGSLVTTAFVEVVDAPLGELSACVMTQCLGGDRIFDDVPVSLGLYDGLGFDPTFSVTSLVLSADLEPSHAARCQ